MKFTTQNRRRAATLIETLVSVVLAAASIGLAAQTVMLAAAQRRLAEQQATALEQAANAMERLFATPWSELNAESASQAKLSPETPLLLPNGKLQIRIEPTGDQPPGKKMTVQVSWKTKRDASPRTVSLSAWRFHTGEPQP